MKRVLVLVEGQTEEAVVTDVLQPHFRECGLCLIPTILTTKRVKAGSDFKGGVTSYKRAKNDLDRLLRDSDAASVTTMLDFYGLPRDFPGWRDIPPNGAVARAKHLEAAWQDAVCHPRFDPHLMLHETEALIFSDPLVCDVVFPEPGTRNALAEIRSGFASPEDINEGPQTAPSKRILRIVPDYQNVLLGPMAIEQIGLERVRAQCPHFAGWLRRIEALAEQDAT